MVDIHSHILPGVDDGAQDLAESLDMLRMAADGGTSDIVATPHAHHMFPFKPDVVERLFAELAAEAKGLIRLHRGCDFHLNFDNLSDALANPAKYTINGGRYLMVELPDYCSLPVMRTALARLMALRIVPVITHPERNGSLCASLRELTDWVGDGALVQVTAQSFFGGFGSQAKKVAESLMNSEMVHFIASDAHNCVERPPDLSSAFKLVTQNWGLDRANALFIDYPSAVIHDQPIFANAPKRVKKGGVLSFWN